MILVAPFWLCQVWFSILTNMAVQFLNELGLLSIGMMSTVSFDSMKAPESRLRPSLSPCGQLDPLQLM